MVLKTFIYYRSRKKEKINVKPCSAIISKFLGLMFKKKSPPLLFIFNREKRLSIHSFFCKPFTAIWLDENKKVLKIEKITRQRFNISGYGKYLLEIPVSSALQ